ncbi:MAG TPA: hypothetical protein VKB63_12740, partial [Gemmatimonadales bacterium]|nr:hypothetical protein [Gemmatimonadales bacterium]
MRKQLVLTVCTAMSVAGLLQGQQWLPPSKNCDVKRSHFLVNGAAQYLEVAATKPALKESQLR